MPYLICCVDQIPVLGYYANSADTAWIRSNEAPDQGSTLTVYRIFMQNTIKLQDPPEELIQMKRADNSSGQIMG